MNAGVAALCLEAVEFGFGIKVCVCVRGKNQTEIKKFYTVQSGDLWSVGLVIHTRNCNGIGRKPVGGALSAADFLPQPQPHFQLVVSRRVFSSQSDRIMSGSARVVITPVSTRAAEQQHCLIMSTRVKVLYQTGAK